VLLVLVIVIGVIVLLSMAQNDRDRKLVQASLDRLQSVERVLLSISSKLENGLRFSSSASAPGGQPQPASRDESWARPGVKVEWQPPWGFTTEPRSLPGFSDGGSFTEIFEAQPPKLTPYLATDNYSRRAIDIVTETLAAYDPKTLRLRGVLAEAWQQDPKGIWLRVKIRDNARFSDGEPVTAEDLRYTFHDFIMNPQIEASRYRSTLADKLERVEAISDKVVEFTFKEAMFDNLDSALTLWVLPKHFYEHVTPADLNKATGLLMGSGPFRLERLNVNDQWTPGEPIVLVRSERYWATPSPLERIVYIAINDELPRLTAYKNGEGDMVTPSAPQFATVIKDPQWAQSNQNLNWVNMKSGNSFIAWNCGERNGKLTPFHDRRVRVAMTHLLDREKMIRDVWSGIGEISKGSSLPISPASNPDLKPWPFDLDKAKALLKEAGWEDRNRNGVIEDADGNEFVFEFTYSTGGEIAQRIALFVQDSCAAAGIRVTLRGIDWSVGDPIRKQRDFDALTMAWGANAPESDPKQIFHSNSIKDQGDNFAQWNNPEADRFIDAGRRELDFDKRQKLWHEFERVMHEDQPYTWIRVQPYVRFVKPDIGNVNTYPKGLEPIEYFRASGPLSNSPAAMR
jgi:peptide/nickel transport system substrate-binding protein